MDLWKNDPENKGLSKAGDDRTPGYRWIGYLYHDGNYVAMPQDNIRRCLMDGGTQVLVPGGKSGKTFKTQTQSGMMCETPYWSFFCNGQQIPMDQINALLGKNDYAAHVRAVQDMGFALFAKRAKIGTSKHIRVRPRFDEWSVEGNLLVWDDQLTLDVLAMILEYGGRYKGLGDWRPGAKTPGPFGIFDSEIEEI